MASGFTIRLIRVLGFGCGDIQGAASGLQGSGLCLGLGGEGLRLQAQGVVLNPKTLNPKP